MVNKNSVDGPVTAGFSGVVLVALVAALVLVAGCGGGGGGGVTLVPAFSGQVNGGSANNPIGGAAITFYAMGNSGYGTGATSLATATSDSSGSFKVALTCPASNSGVQTYITAVGGNPGSGTNSGIGLMALSGPCNALTTSSFVMVNELTTAAAEYALAQFSDSTGKTIGTSSTNATGPADAVGLATTNLVVSFMVWREFGQYRDSGSVLGQQWCDRSGLHRWSRINQLRWPGADGHDRQYCRYVHRQLGSERDAPNLRCCHDGMRHPVRLHRHARHWDHA